MRRLPRIRPLFKGGKADFIHSLTTLAAPSNGTTAYEAPSEDKDTAAYDMYIDNALALNERMVTDENTFYFAIPCSATTKQADGTVKIDDTMCTGCGLCETLCKFDAIELLKAGDK